MAATQRSAAVAGAWSALWLVPFETWMGDHIPRSTLQHDVFWLVALAVFFVIPTYLLVIGRDTKPFTRTWFLDPDQRARYAVVVKRMLVWLITAGAVAAIWSKVLTLVASKVAAP